MANRAVLPELVAQVKTFFVAEGVDTVVDIGWKPVTRQDNQGPGGANRVIFDMNGAKEKLLPPKGGTSRAMANGNRSRCLCTIEWSVPVQFWAADRETPGDPENEIAQIEAYVGMFERTTQAIEAFAAGSYHWADGETPKQPIERTFGRFWTKTLVILEDIYDVENGVALPGFTIQPNLQRQV